MADLTITIDAKTLAGVGESFRQLERNLSSLRQQLERAANPAPANALKSQLTQLGVTLDAVAARATRLGAAITAALAGATAALIRAGSQAIATEKAFTTLTGSAARAQKLIDAINREAAQSVLNYTDMLTAAQRLLAAGVRESDILPTLRAIGDALAASGEISRENALAITKAITDITNKGKLQAQELIQLANAGVPALKILREELRMTETQFAEFMQGKRSLGAGDALRALVAGLRREYGGLQQEMMDTPLGQISNLYDNLARALRAAGTPLAQAIVPALKEINAQLSRIIESGNLAKLAPLFAELARVGGAALNMLLSTLAKLADLFANLPKPIQTATAALLILLGPGSLALAGAIKLYTAIRNIVLAMRALITTTYAAIGAQRLFNATTATGAAGAAGAAGARAAAGAGGALGALGRIAGVAGVFLATTATADAPTIPFEVHLEKAIWRTLPPSAARLTPEQRLELAKSEAAALAPIARQHFAENRIDLGGDPVATIERELPRIRQRAQSLAPNIPEPNLPEPPDLFANLPNLSETEAKAKARAAKTVDPLAIGRARVELARQILSLQIPTISALIDANKLDEARRKLAELRRELLQLARAAAQIRIQEEERATGRKLTERERQAVAQLTQRDLLADITQLEAQIERILDAQNAERERALQLERERRAQLLRDIHQLQVQLERARASALPPEAQLQALPAIHQRELAPLYAELTTAMLGGDPLAIGRAALQIQLERARQTQELQRIQDQIAAQQAQRARDLAAAREQALQLERELARTRQYAALTLADAEIQNAQRQLQTLQQQGAARELLKAQETAILQATKRKLQLELETLEAVQAQLRTDKNRLAVQIQLLNTLGDASLAQRNALLQQAIQIEKSLADTEARLTIIRNELRILKQVGDANNPFAYWQAALQSAIGQLNRDLADALLGLRRAANPLKDFFRNLARDFLSILLRELLNPLYLALQAVAQQIAAAVLSAFGVQSAATAALSNTALGAGLAALGGPLAAAGIAYAAAPALKLNPTGAAIGAGVGFLVGGPIGALLGGFAGGLFGRRSASPTPPQILPISAPRIIRNDIRLYIDNRELARAVVTNAY
jgi:tape measure domain-containing protein